MIILIVIIAGLFLTLRASLWEGWGIRLARNDRSKHYTDAFDGWACWFFGLMITTFTVAAVAAFFAIPAFWEAWHETRTPVQTKHHVVTVADNPGSHSELHGALFFISGSTEGELQISFYEQGPHHVLRPRTIGNSDGDVRIHNVKAGAKPRVVQSWTHVEDTPNAVLMYPEWPTFTEDVDYAYDVYVPAGTVKHGYSLDAQ